MAATMIRTQHAQTLGEYTPTLVDAGKSAADIRVVDADGTFTVISKISLAGRGIAVRAAAGTYEVTKAAMARLQKEYSVACDF